MVTIHYSDFFFLVVGSPDATTRDSSRIFGTLATMVRD